MKSLKNIMEAKRTISQYISELTSLLNSKKTDIYPGYHTSFCNTLIDMLNDYGVGSNKDIMFKSPNKFSGFDLIGLTTSVDNDPCVYVDCKDGQKPFVLSISSLIKAGALRLRGRVTVDSLCLILCITNGYIEAALTTKPNVKQNPVADKVSTVTVDKKTFQDIIYKFERDAYSQVETELIDIVNSYGKDDSRCKYVYLGNSEEYTWNHHIDKIYVHRNKPNEIHFNVYWQGDSTDGDEVMTFMELCNKSEQRVKFGREYFRLERNEVLDAINRLKNILLK